MSATIDRPVKRRYEILFGRYTLNPMIRAMFKLGVTPPRMALVETSVTPALGASVTPGPVLVISSTAPQVTIELNAAEQSSVKVGDAVSITLPNEQTTPGVVRSVGSDPI